MNLHSIRPVCLAVTIWIPWVAHGESYDGIYFGTFDDTRGHWALAVHGGTCELVGYLVDYQQAIIGYPIGLGDAGDVWSIEDRVTFASIKDGNVTGSYSPSWYSMPLVEHPVSGMREVDAGGFGLRIEGFYELPGPGDFTIQVQVIVGRSGRFVISAWIPGAISELGAAGELDADGHASFAEPGGLTGELSVSPDGHMEARLIDPNTGATVVRQGRVQNNRLVNLSTRGTVDSSDATMITGFVIAGSGTKQILLRAMGPALAGDPFDLPGTIADPMVEVYRDQNLIARADNWGENGDADDLSAAVGATGAFPAPSGSKDAMILLDLAPGSYSAVLRGANGAHGTGLAEIYAVNDFATRDVRLVNVSTRGYVGTGDTVMIPGFVSHGGRATQLLVRAIGPTLGEAPFGVANVLADPIVTVYRQGDTTPVGTNDDWSTDEPGLVPYLQAAMAKAGAFPLELGTHDSALLIAIEPNTAYTVVVTGQNGGTGVALAEAYEVETAP